MKVNQQYNSIKWYIFAVVVGILSLLAIDNLGFFEGIDNYFYDLSFRMRGSLKADERIIIIAIDEKTLERLGRWPLNRIHYAQLIDFMKEASVVGLDIIMGEPTEDDPELSSAMARHGKVILPVYIETDLRISYPAPKPASYKTGHIHIEHDVDGIIRKVFHLVYYQDHAIPSFSSVLYETATGITLNRGDGMKAGIGEEKSLRIIQSMPMNINFYGPPATFQRISFVDVLQGYYIPSFFKDKIILVGITSEGIADHKLIPFTQHRNRMAGVEIQANILNNLLDNNAVRIADEWLRLSLIFITSLLCIFLFAKLGEKAAAFFWLSGLIVIPAGIFFLFISQNMWIRPSLFYCAISFLYMTAYLLKLDKAARQLDMKYLTISERMGWDVNTNRKENGEKGIVSFLSLGGINTKIQRLLAIEQHYEKKLEDTVQKKTEKLLKSEAELNESYATQALLNMILNESLKNIPLELILEKSVSMITAIPGVPFEPTGSILLVEENPDVLVMKTRSKMDEGLCSEVPFGRCLCGQAALTQEIQFTDQSDEYHETCRKEAYRSHHGHYAVPILYGGRTSGVLNIYLAEGEARNKKVEEFLYSVVNILSGIIERKKVQSDREKLQSQLLQAQKMEAVGQLAGGIAHDFNNLLTAIIGYGHLLKNQASQDDRMSTYVGHILNAAERAAVLTNDLLTFSRKQIVNPQPVNPNIIIKNIESLLLRLIGEDIKLSTVLSDTDLTIMADSTQIDQILMNLVTNAQDAMPKGGELIIRTGRVEINDEYIKAHGYGKPGSYALLSVEDTGIGMDEKIRQRIFEPFFTTKEVGKGTGLGLSMVYGIVKQHDGYISVYSEPGRGTAFKILLPLIQSRIEKLKPNDLIKIKGGTETILIGEDDTQVRNLLKEVLSNAGYHIIEAVDGDNAVEVFHKNKDTIHLLVLDVIMPKKNGKEVYTEIKKVKSDMKVIFVSGYSADIIHKKEILDIGLNFISKPVSPDELLIRVRDVLDK